jgi:hypothetical protein
VPAGAAAVVAALLTAGGGSAGANVAPAPVYSALSSTAPTGLVLGASGDRSADAPAVPTFPATPPEGATAWPVASSIRRLSLPGSDMSAWIARSTAGGICVLLYDGVPVRGVAAVYAGCSAAGAAARGTSIEVDEIPGLPGETIAAGVVPDGVQAVSEQLADGSTAVTAVSDNAWLRVGSQPAAPGEEPTEITGG